LTQGHDRSADFWAFGALIYELLCQRSPFVGRNQQRTFEKIVHSHRYLSFANKFDAHAKSLLRKLLNPNPSIRLGCLRNGVQDIKEDYFFHDVNFNDLLAQRIAMPYIPDLSDDPTERLHVHGVVMDDQLDLEEELAMETVPSEYDSFFEELMGDIAF
jgi:serine/threonine protein kinase